MNRACKVNHKSFSPINAWSSLPKNPDGDWWELWDEKHNLPYYYHTRANVSNWMRPTDTNIISLVKIRVSSFFFFFFLFLFTTWIAFRRILKANVFIG